MGEEKKLTAQEIDELRMHLETEQSKTESEAEERSSKPVKPLVVTISDDRMQARIYAVDPGADNHYSKEEIFSFLKNNNVTAGIDENMVDQLAAGLRYDEDVLIASGQAMQQSKDGYFEFLFETRPAKEPIIRPDGTADYSAVGRLQNITAGDVVARYHPAVPGSKGFTVIGVEILPKPVKELTPLRGKNISRNDETGEYTATAAGKISYSSGNIEILTLHEIHGDVDLVTGTVEFYGDIVIYGNVESGVIIRAGRNLTITGTVGPARLFAGGDIVLEKGIQGGEKGTVSARGNVLAEFIEYAKVTAGLDVSAGSIINSTVNAGNNVILKGKRASVMGGSVHALSSISAKSVGSVSEMRTILHTGLLEEDYRFFTELLSMEKKYRQELGSIMGRLKEMLLAKQEGRLVLNQFQKQELFDMNEKKNLIYEQLDRITTEKEKLEKKMKDGENSWISVTGDIYRGVVICIGIYKLAVMSKQTYVRYICRDGMVEATPVIRT